MKKIVFIICCVLFFGYAAYFLQVLKFDPEAYFGGDSGGYQIMAVNLAKGKGLMLTGGVAGDYTTDYKLSKNYGDAGTEGYKWFIESGKSGGYYNFYRTPGYIVFLGIIYRIFGVNPLIAKQIQLLLLVAVGAFLPAIGYNYWKKQGLAAGIIAGALFLFQYAKAAPAGGGVTTPNEILTETLITFSVFVIVLAFMYWERRKNLTSAWVLGIIIGIGMLIKASLIFLPILVGGYFLQLTVKNKIKMAAVFVLGMLVAVAPWSFYASRKTGHFVFLSTQGEAVFFDGNNELAADGGWHPEGYSSRNPNIFYNRPGIKDLPVLPKATAFYTTHAYLIPGIFMAKIRSAFEIFFFFKAGLVLVIFELVRRMLLVVKIKNKAPPIIKSVLNTAAALTAVLVSQIFNTRPSLLPVVGSIYYVNVLLAAFILISGMYAAIGKKDFYEVIPPVFGLLISNFILLSVVLFGYPRFIQVIDWIFILVAVKYGLSLFDNIFYGVRNRNIG